MSGQSGIYETPMRQGASSRGSGLERDLLRGGMPQRNVVSAFVISPVLLGVAMSRKAKARAPALNAVNSYNDMHQQSPTCRSHPQRATPRKHPQP